MKWKGEMGNGMSEWSYGGHQEWWWRIKKGRIGKRERRKRTLLTQLYQWSKRNTRIRKKRKERTEVEMVQIADVAWMDCLFVSSHWSYSLFMSLPLSLHSALTSSPYSSHSRFPQKKRKRIIKRKKKRNERERENWVFHLHINCSSLTFFSRVPILG